jgi:3-oxoacyl-[acyl-carrier protein] reductase
MLAFEDKVAVVTGSGRGIGKATAQLLSDGGAKVVINDLDADVAEQAAGEIGGEVAVHAGNLRDEGAADELIDTAVRAWGRVDIVVNNAGYTLDGPLHKMTEDAFQEMLDIHTVVPFRVLRAAARHIRPAAKEEREAGREVFRKVVNVTSVAGTMGNPGQANYASGKAALVGLTKTLAKEWGPLKVNVNAVAFGFVDTRLTAPKSEETKIQIDGRPIAVGVPTQTREMLEGLIALRRPATAHEAAGAIAFLCSPWSDYVTGQVLTVSGGLAMGLTT